jgi:hypothetical protein
MGQPYLNDMSSTPLRVVRDSIGRSELITLAQSQFGDMVKAVVDLRRGIMAIGGELHSDEEALLLDEGSAQADLWGVNLYPDEADEAWIEFDSMINVRPSQGNRSRAVEDPTAQEHIRRVVTSLVRD